ncbi:alpha/beta fold hydrolase [Phytoactinopolyspora mesophila]|uniref:Alpha/beta fold hydrolase n=1 Tax=Phytoactinopolyspora mesophila TaxID=2650750 RepID=A0A7K3LYU2_9ACTN|nr:alpha/beta hydrolase [Phytoactinopolyspora mesophila]NDL56186.1 alpha/beta fold hydrolase [Phytoactinopolyspora mesophila]
MATYSTVESSVVSRDGTEIVYWTSGDGSPIVLVHGAPADHTRWRPLLPYVEEHLTVHAMDRRGSGASGDAVAYSLEREYEDVAAVIDAVAAACGQNVDVYGHSHGAMAAFGAATLTANLRKLVLYEGWPAPDPSIYALPVEVMERMNHLLADGNRGGVVETLFRAIENVSDEDVAWLRSAPSWPGRVAAAEALPREISAETRARLEPEQAAKITVPVLLVTGEESTDPAKAEVDTVADALPDARHLELAGQQHIGDILAPETFATHLLQFLHGSP